MNSFVRIFGAGILVLLVAGCATGPLINTNEMAEAIATVYISQSMELLAICPAFYAANDRWPLDIEELRVFRDSLGEAMEPSTTSKKSKMPVLPITHERFDDTRFYSLPGGELEITLSNYEKLQGFSFRISRPVRMLTTIKYALRPLRTFEIVGGNTNISGLKLEYLTEVLIKHKNAYPEAVYQLISEVKSTPDEEAQILQAIENAGIRLKHYWFPTSDTTTEGTVPQSISFTDKLRSKIEE